MVELKGSLDSASLPAIVQLIGELRHSGRLDLTNGSVRASLGFEDGHLIAASLGDQKGLPALVACVQSFGSGQFVFSERVAAGERSLDLGPDGLAAQLTRLADPARSGEPEPPASGPLPAEERPRPEACPRLGFADDPTRHYSRPTGLHRCFATGEGITVSTAEQRDLCLGGGYPTCPRYRGEVSGTPAPAPPDRVAPSMPAGVVRRLAAANQMRISSDAERPDASDAVRLEASNTTLPSAGGSGPGSAAVDDTDRPGGQGLLSPPVPLSPRPAPAVGPAPRRAPRVDPPASSEVADQKPRFLRGKVLIAGGALLALALIAVAAVVFVPSLNRALVGRQSAGATQVFELAPTPVPAAAGAVRPTVVPVTASRAQSAGSPAAAAAPTPVRSTAAPGTAAGAAATNQTSAPVVVAGATSVGLPAAGPSASGVANAPPSPSVATTTPPLIDIRFASTTASNWLENPPFAGFSDGAYRLQARQATRFVAVAAPIEQPLRDVVVSATFRKTGGPPGGGYGLIIRDQGPAPHDGVNQNLSAYVLETGDQGEYGVWRRDGDHWVDLVPWTHSANVRLGGSPNDLMVRAIGDQLTFSVNGTELTSLHDGTLAQGGVGVFVGGDFNEVALDHFMVQVPD